MGFFEGLKLNTDARRINNEAQKIIDTSINKLDEENQRMLDVFETHGKLKFRVLANSVHIFIENFEKIKNIELIETNINQDLKNIKLTKSDFNEMKKASIKSSLLLAGGASSLSMGALLGMGTYGTIGSVATASTGTAISSLSGVAARKATLAWLGGGSLATGGGGVIAGTYVLGAIVLIPTILIWGITYTARAKSKLADAKVHKLKARKFDKENLIKVKKITAIIKRVDQMKKTLYILSKYLKTHVDIMNNTIQKYGNDYSTYPESAKKHIYTALMFAQATKSILDINLLTKDGDFSNNVRYSLLKLNFFLLKYKLMSYFTNIKRFSLNLFKIKNKSLAID